MKTTTETGSQILSPACDSRRGQRLLIVSILLLAAGGFAATLNNAGALSSAAAAFSFGPGATEPQGAEPDYSRFAHSSSAHSRLPCLTCHRREDRAVQPNRPGHRPCSACHSQKFADLKGPICTTCHTTPEPKGGDLKSPPKLNGFSVKFNHSLHAGSACSTCHKSINKGVALSIPSGSAAHATCYECHTPGKEAEGGAAVSCSMCHEKGPYGRFAVAARAYKVGFSHAAHNARGRLSCTECHYVRSGAPPQDQVTRPNPLMHHASGQAQSCITCHNNQRAFGADSFSDCKKCHQGSTFRS